MNKTSDYRLIFELIKPYKGEIFISIFMTFVSSAIFGVSLLAVFPVVKSVFFTSSSGGSGIFQTIHNWLGTISSSGIPGPLATLSIYSLTLIVDSTFSYILQYVKSRLTEKITTDCRIITLSAIQSMNYANFQKHERGEYVQILITETRSVYAVFKQLLNLMQTVTNTAICLIVLCIISTKLTFICVLSLLLVAICNMLITRIIKKVARKAITERISLSSAVVDIVSGAKQIRLYNAEKIASDMLLKVSVKCEAVARNLANINAAQPLATNLLTIFSFFIVVVLPFYIPDIFGGKDIKVSLVSFVVVLMRVLSPLAQFTKEYGTLHANLPIARKLSDFIYAKSRQTEKESTCEVSATGGHIKLKDLSFAYAPDKLVLDNVSLCIEPGEYIGLMGPSGVGKSTLLNLIPRLLEPQQGSLTVGGTDVRALDRRTLRAKIGLLSQDFYLFNGSIRQNLLIAQPGATEAQMWHALERAGLKSLVEELPQGLDTPLGHNGELLSGGQRQRLGLACILLRDSEIILLDEGLSAVDEGTEKLILEQLKLLNHEGKTIISSSHKRATLKDANRIFTIEQGRIK